MFQDVLFSVVTSVPAGGCPSVYNTYPGRGDVAAVVCICRVEVRQLYASTCLFEISDESVIPLLMTAK